ncbi:hypothetical protein ACJMK2_039097 [Sinanodonta woodiana]|uniref:BTB domain-containing protein n=1 Tax=Sinanodonta woodiana TaxID=1069815 RepID=A0ABD3WB44_SINWO
MHSMEVAAGSSWRSEVSSVVYGALEEMFHSGRHTDTEIIVQSKSFRCHKVILATVSEYFDAMFSSGMRECFNGVVNLHGIECSTFENILDFIYSGRESIDTNNAENLLKAASMFRIRLLHEKCEEFLLRHVSVENCIGAWRLARDYECQTLAKKAWAFIMEYFIEVSQTEDFNYMHAVDIIAMVNENELNVASEEIVCDAVFRWYNFDPENRKDSVLKMFESLRLPLLSSEYLLHEIEPMKVVSENPRCRSIVKEAISYQMLPARRPDFNSPRVAFRNFSNMEEVLVVLGGYDEKGDKMLDVMGYSFLQKKWFSLSSLPIKLGREFASCVYGNDIYVSGGSTKPDNLLQYRAENNEWIICPAMTQGRRRHAIVAVGESLFVLGGYDDKATDEVEKTLTCILEYGVNSRRWEAVGKLATPVRSMSASVSKEKIFVFGGILNDEKETQMVQCFDTRLRTCFLVTDMPYPCKLCKSVVCDKRIFIICTDGNIFEMYDDMRCERIAKIKDFNRRRFGAIHYKGMIMIFGGEYASTTHRDIFSFHVDTEEITSFTDDNFPFRVNFGGLKIVLHKRFLIKEFSVKSD